MGKSSRIHNLDYLRGLAAFGVMIFHYFSWTYGSQTSNSFLERVGYYGVSIFYILSGLTLYHVYFKKMTPTKIEIYSFIRKRIFRIFPLLWLVTICAILLSRKIPNLGDLFLNLSGLFGFVKWDTYFSAGIWSIGNEIVFYLFFPFFIYFTKSKKYLMIILSILITCFFLHFTFYRLNGVDDNFWSLYINPLNQVFLFLAGFLIGLFFSNKNIRNIICISLILVPLLIFIFFPVKGELTNLVLGWNRIFFTLICISICIGFYKIQLNLPKILHQPLAYVGEISYSVYLLHPLIFRIITFATTKAKVSLDSNYRIVISIVLTLFLSSISFNRFEKYFIRLGNKVRIGS